MDINKILELVDLPEWDGKYICPVCKKEVEVILKVDNEFCAECGAKF